MTSANNKRDHPLCITFNEDEMENIAEAKARLSIEKGTKISNRLLVSILVFRYLHGGLGELEAESTAESNNRILEQMKEMIEQQIEKNNKRIEGE